ncbi:PIG-L deacetylase family protein [Bordetella genomosp. 13]|uniref:PIG-L family deacetylase n=1 Tax=Bordetella genomosp. 13 TaxID=463040 RepID=A0A1W6ZA04_9BORD|nr:PIG-L family deacetylase [Bordetella genomosp. 13]ARP94149.1 hypothetical protein CAL15_06985 [Bordetella genomosp. 13]
MDHTARLLVISPHYDDAVLGCGDLLAATPGATVLTVCSGVPPADAPLPQWDRECGYRRPHEAMLAREREDSLALAALNAHALRLGVLDSQYGGPLDVAELRHLLAGALAQLRPRQVYIPLGLFHDDHIRISDALLDLYAGQQDGAAWHAYEEALYRCKPGLLQKRLARLLDSGVQATPQPGPPGAGERKAEAVRAYASQLRPLGLADGGGDPARPERYWLLERLPRADGARS